MTALHRQRLYIVLFFILGICIAITLAIVALKDNVNHYFTPTQITNNQIPLNKKIRGGGIVVPGSIQRSTNSLNTKFIISDGVNSVQVNYEGILPDLFTENSASVVVGYVNTQGVFIAKEVLAKHDSYYMPKEVKQAMDKAKENINKQINR